MFEIYSNIRILNSSLLGKVRFNKCMFWFVLLCSNSEPKGHSVNTIWLFIIIYQIFGLLATMYSTRSYRCGHVAGKNPWLSAWERERIHKRVCVIKGLKFSESTVKEKSQALAGLPRGYQRLLRGLPWWRSGWESACQCRGHGFEPWSGKIPHAAEQLGPWATIAEPALLEPVLRNKIGRDSERPAHCDEEWPPLAATREGPRTETKTQHSHK